MEEVRYKENVNAKFLSTYRGGGNVRFVVYPTTISMIRKVITFARSEGIPFFILGNGSNTLITDKLHNSIFINTKFMDKVSFSGNNIYSGCGTNIKRLYNISYNLGLSGLEELALIPATIGGLTVSGGGCFGREIADLIVDVDVLNLSTLVVERIPINDINFAYRYCDLKGKYLVIGVRLKLALCDKQDILSRFNECKSCRQNTQPKLCSLGSVYKREDYIPAKLIDSLGLKGFSVGGAMVSNKHANFIVNTGNGTATDYIRVMEKIESRVYSEFAVNLKREINII